MLHSIVAEVADVPVETLHPPDALGEDLGLDSLRRVELLATLEAELGIYLDESQVSGTTTVEELEAMVARAGEASSKPAYPEWALSGLARLGRAAFQSLLAFPILRLFMSGKAHGVEHMNGLRGPVLFAANHLSHMDTPTVLAALPGHRRSRTAVAAAADVWFDRGRLPAGLAALLFNAFPFSRTDSIRPSLEHCGRLLDRGWSVLIYPEGTRSASGRMGPFKSGTGLMAVELGVPVVPLYIQRTYEVLSRDQLFPRRGRVRVRFGRALRFTRGASFIEATKTIEEAVRALGEATGVAAQAQ